MVTEVSDEDIIVLDDDTGDETEAASQTQGVSPSGRSVSIMDGFTSMVPDQDQHIDDEEFLQLMNDIENDDSIANKQAEVKEIQLEDFKTAAQAASFPGIGRSTGGSLSKYFNPQQIAAISKVEILKFSNNEKKEIRSQIAKFLRTKEFDLDRLIRRVRQAKYSGENFVSFILDPANEIIIKDDGTKVLVIKTGAEVLKNFLFQPITRPVVELYNCIKDEVCQAALRKCEVLGSPDEIVHSFTMPLLNSGLKGVGSFCAVGGSNGDLKLNCRSRHQEDIENQMNDYMAAMRLYYTNKPPQMAGREKYENLDEAIKNQEPLSLSGGLRTLNGNPKVKKATPRKAKGRSSHIAPGGGIYDPNHFCTDDGQKI